MGTYIVNAYIFVQWLCNHSRIVSVSCFSATFCQPQVYQACSTQRKNWHLIYLCNRQWLVTAFNELGGKSEYVWDQSESIPRLFTETILHFWSELSLIIAHYTSMLAVQVCHLAHSVAIRNIVNSIVSWSIASIILYTTSVANFSSACCALVYLTPQVDCIHICWLWTYLRTCLCTAYALYKMRTIT